ncbi:MAG: tRNA (adenosine(37)-N6)-dimethylallyltransferase MiaA [Deltaproteobacteria bacterium GWC2_56_8]|nr:MAG: tRNA (adenosine(37)-N6)-dimethylallyltransferase MiaA [Deltaproteobacteria bacterium GWB2_55_19]OGP38644.1 MAG: tRNA (adenosine(37)-N6)-dimethylallyltransferase MiaA [Deltaproteobacteria bacterium GWC2_56_8]HAO93724.1 tRNA (adenosine(37)-N6)-dimethylallyltransferase MiaA [Deltaproteobacteria bacterium]
MEKERIVIIAGPTASGKSALAIDLALEFNGEIVSADSMQVFKAMDIGTAKPSREDMQRVPHHLIDIVEPNGDYTVARFRNDAIKAVSGIRSRGRNAFVTGGTGLYIKALTQGLFPGPKADPDLRMALEKESVDALYERLQQIDPETAASIHPNNRVRVIRALEVYELTGTPISTFRKEHGFRDELFECLKIGLDCPREALYKRIDERVDKMIEAGLPEETKRLFDAGFGWDLKPMLGLGYKEMAMFLRGACALPEAIELLKRNTRRYAKRQLTWFRADPEMTWFSPEEKKGIFGAVKGHLR